MLSKGRLWLLVVLLCLLPLSTAHAEDWFGRLRSAVAARLENAGAVPPPSPTTVPASGSIEVAFSPGGGATQAVVDALDQARRVVLVQAYSFTSAPIAKALVRAAKRGVKVTVVLDKSQRTERYSEADFFANQGIPVYIDDQHAIAHNKVMVIDDETVITGSFNFTRAAERSNAENLLILRGNPRLGTLYAQNFRFHLSHSTPFTARHGMD